MKDEIERVSASASDAGILPETASVCRVQAVRRPLANGCPMWKPLLPPDAGREEERGEGAGDGSREASARSVRQRDEALPAGTDADDGDAPRMAAVA